ncbi:MAG: YggS family pyridoxal phosphate-dependent enzyme [Candidatus Accumulibacter sp.]|uniref:YggS family pyridoxal phosphate-dependent enzyme n=1 Tax=Accumulibacter sp. TaxID=2053492 RepID=UPI002878DE12|nr:YggS family pyridoxal phosphate-dependent enzyme [Accumulibacter sp.]MDS4012768.1 YggS family pyridoxal phosphate-dependent enzyme [Accumulibacter sp.]
MTTLPAKLQAVLARIAAAARQFGRKPEEVRLLAVSKTRSTDCIRAVAAAGQLAFGENHVQEGVAKARELSALTLDWHFIGSLQANKTRLVAENFAWVHSLDRLSIAERLSAQRPASLPPLSVCLQVNVSGEASKGGVAPGAATPLAQAIAALPRLRLRGLMTIPRPSKDFLEQRHAFRRLRELAEQMQATGLQFDTLSMGMSDDLEAAVAEGATLVRVGTAIFGERTTA